MKESELGIGQTLLLTYWYNLVGYLPRMYTHELFIGTKQPKEIASYETLSFPFDAHVWASILAVVIIELVILITIQRVWCIGLEEGLTLNLIYEGSMNHFVL